MSARRVIGQSVRWQRDALGSSEAGFRALSVTRAVEGVDNVDRGGEPDGWTRPAYTQADRNHLRK
jgi:hypothetical protein